MPHGLTERLTQGNHKRPNPAPARTKRQGIKRKAPLEKGQTTLSFALVTTSGTDAKVQNSGRNDGPSRDQVDTPWAHTRRTRARLISVSDDDGSEGDADRPAAGDGVYESAQDDEGESADKGGRRDRSTVQRRDAADRDQGNKEPP